jgi:nickel/cobalt transporter (NiCoT) family protein
MSVLTAPGSVRMGQLVRQSFTTMTRQERTRVIAMYGAILGLHVLGLFILFVFVVPSHYKGLGIGVSILAYTLGLRHAFDADHISAIDNTTRKVMSDRQGTGQPRPFGFGFFFSLGHSTVVVAIGVGIVVAEKTVFSAVSHSGSGLERFGGLSGGFWGFMYNFNINTAGFVIVGMFILTWLAALLIWRFGRVEEKWSSRLQPQGVPGGAPATAANGLDRGTHLGPFGVNGFER